MRNGLARSDTCSLGRLLAVNRAAKEPESTRSNGGIIPRSPCAFPRVADRRCGQRLGQGRGRADVGALAWAVTRRGGTCARRCSSDAGGSRGQQRPPGRIPEGGAHVYRTRVDCDTRTGTYGRCFGGVGVGKVLVGPERQGRDACARAATAAVGAAHEAR